MKQRPACQPSSRLIRGGSRSSRSPFSPGRPPPDSASRRRVPRRGRRPGAHSNSLGRPGFPPRRRSGFGPRRPPRRPTTRDRRPYAESFPSSATSRDSRRFVRLETLAVSERGPRRSRSSSSGKPALPGPAGPCAMTSASSFISSQYPRRRGRRQGSERFMLARTSS